LKPLLSGQPLVPLQAQLLAAEKVQESELALEPLSDSALGS
jgi:hypothetical protein